MAISLSDSEDENTKTDAHPRAKKTAQSEEAFQAVKAEYRPKVENGEVWSFHPARQAHLTDMPSGS